MKSVFIVTDLEGTAGVVSFADQSASDGRYYDAAKKLATAEINAAVTGLTEVGVNDILIWDGHGAGGITFEDLHPAAKLLHGRPMPPWSRLQHIIRRYEAVIMIGQHALAGTLTGNQNHTQNSRTVDYYKLNGRPIGETAQIALYFGALGLPLIFLSGDADACREAEALVAGLSTAAVKEGVGRGAAISLSAVEARKSITKGVREAVKKQRITPIPPLVWESPYVLEKRFFHTDVADAAAAQPGVERVDSQTVRVHGDDILEVIYR